MDTEQHIEPALGPSELNYDTTLENSWRHAEAKLFCHEHIADKQRTDLANARFDDPDNQDQWAKSSSASIPANLLSPELNSESQNPNAPARFPDQHMSLELRRIVSSIYKILQIRRKYIAQSLQRDSDNPNCADDWKILPLKASSPPSNMDRVESSRASKATSSQPQSSLSRAKDQCLCTAAEQRVRLSYDEYYPLPCRDDLITFEQNSEGTFELHHTSSSHHGNLPQVPSLRDYYLCLDNILAIAADGPTKSFAFRRLAILEGKYQLYNLESSYQEIVDTKKVPHRDFYNVRKIDTHVHHSASMTQKHLLRFIKSKLEKCPSEIVLHRDKQYLTLKQVFQSLQLTAHDLSIDTLDMHAHSDTFHRFDKFNLKYNPVGESRLREIFLKTDNLIRGKYLAELTREVIDDLESSKYQFAEWRLSIYGRSPHEWRKLAAWIVDNELFSDQIRWLIQVPRLYDSYKETSEIENFGVLLDNIFRPLFEVTQDPSLDPKLHIFLQRIVGFDSVDDESKSEVRLFKKFPAAGQWGTAQNPPYTYWIYYLFANMSSLNTWRARRGFNTFVLRPHCGEAGDVSHVAAAALCCHGISHGLMLRKTPVIQYVFYLEQIGIAMSPSSNNALFLAYDRSPFQQYFNRGLNVSLSTDDPLQFAFTKEPLIEEYALAAQIYRLTAVDMCELARNSVIQSGFERSLKMAWLGKNYQSKTAETEGVEKTNVPALRKTYRTLALDSEFSMLVSLAGDFVTQEETTTTPPMYFDNRILNDNGFSDEPTTFRASIQTDLDKGYGFSDSDPNIHTHSTFKVPHSSSQAQIFPGLVHQVHQRKFQDTSSV